MTWFKKLGGTRKVIKVGKISEKDDILTVEGKQAVLIGSKTQRRIEMNPRQRDLEARHLKASKMWIMKGIEK